MSVQRMLRLAPLPLAGRTCPDPVWPERSRPLGTYSSYRVASRPGRAVPRKTCDPFPQSYSVRPIVSAVALTAATTAHAETCFLVANVCFSYKAIGMLVCFFASLQSEEFAARSSKSRYATHL